MGNEGKREEKTIIMGAISRPKLPTEPPAPTQPFSPPEMQYSRPQPEPRIDLAPVISINQPAIIQDQPSVQPAKRRNHLIWIAPTALLLFVAAVFLLRPGNPGFDILVHDVSFDASVFVDDARLGVPAADGTIRVIGLKPGRRKLVVSAGGKNFQETVEGTAGSIKDIWPRLSDSPLRSAHQQALIDRLSQIMKIQPRPDGFAVIMPEVSFETNQSNLQQTAQNQLSKLVAILQTESEKYKVVVAGYTDNIGTREKNLALSRERAQSVTRFLIGNGLPSARVNRTEGLGDANPIASNQTEQGRRENRRVEIVITDLEN